MTATEPTPADPSAYPPWPTGWNAATWKAICESTTCLAANAIIARTKQLLEDVQDWLNDHPEHADINVLQAARVPLPPTLGIDQLEHCRRHFAGLV